VLITFLLSLLGHQGLADGPLLPSAVSVSWRATGGAITPQGLYTAGPSAGSFRVSAVEGSNRAVVTVTVAAPPSPVAAPPSPVTPAPSARAAAPPITGVPRVGIPFGAFGIRRTQAADGGDEAFTLIIGAQTPRDVASQIQSARARGKKLILAMAGGAHRQYLTDGVFDMDKWMRRMREYDTQQIRDAIAGGVADGTVVGNSVMDEPNNTSPDNSWGPKGTMNKARVDSMCAYVKQIFPTLPTGVVHDYRAFDPRHTYAVCDFVVSQYSERRGPVTAYRDAALEFARENGVAIAFSMNILDGGSRVPGCPVPETGGRGTFRANCRMRPDQIRSYGMVLGPAGCAFTMWRFDNAFMALPENRQAFHDLAAAFAKIPAKPCRRS